MKPIVSFPAETAGAELVRSGANRQLWRAFLGTEAVALRLGRFVGSAPLFDPPQIISGAADVAARLGLSSIAPLIAAGSSGDGFFVAERWIAGEPIDRVRSPEEAMLALRAVAADLVRLHAAGKWHGGVRASRIIAGEQSGYLAGFGWSSFATTLTRGSFSALLGGDGGCLAPELSVRGPKAAGPACDVYGFGRVALAIARSEDLTELLARAISVDPNARPTMVELLAALNRARAS